MPAGQRSKCKWDGGGIPGTRPQQPLAFDGHLRQPARRRMLAAGVRGGPQDGRKRMQNVAHHRAPSVGQQKHDIFEGLEITRRNFYQAIRSGGSSIY